MMHIFRKFNPLYFFSGLFCLLLSLGLHAQRISIHHKQLQFLFEDSLLQLPNYHSGLLPFEIQVDALNKKFQSQAVQKKSIFIAPVLDAIARFQQKDFTYRLGQGGYMAANLGKKAGFELSAVLYEEKFPGNSFSIDSLKLIPRYNRYLWGKNENAAYLGIRGNIYWKAYRGLTFTAGYDKNFIGDGQHSLFLSENAAAYPFFQTQIKLWNIQYQHQVMFMRDLVYGSGSTRFIKYSSQHVLSYNVNPSINIYIFETVIWRKQDSTRYRGFDLTYLNPFLFFRPVEYNQGSPDNVIMGIGGKVRVFGKTYVYGQFLLDEFHLKEVKANRNWWGSKYGYQIGFKSYGLFHSKPSLLLVEYNHMRPFTYSHSSSLQNYGYLKEPLAHPLGSNFRELTGVLRVALTKNLFIYGKAAFMRYGTDPEGLNYGSDIYKRQWTFSKYYGNYITQGILNTVISGELTVSKMLIPAWRLTAFSAVNLTMQKTGEENKFLPMVQFGLNTLLYE